MAELNQLLDAMASAVSSPELKQDLEKWRQEREDMDRFQEIMKRVHKKIRKPIVLFSVEGNPDDAIMHPALAEELSKPENAGAWEVLKKWSRMGKPL